ncbi:MAG: hypothetical protein G01um101418_612 [Parcubacteria group bacterium Gr01-1014_18]|nr:MAG: hypothetical protein Greene041636_97 [Parcubacteria group bacterium Greene0416_36]TSC80864.1 MAG: hypothetical protein G01um101418_612 [Parcubacteria group bacterium Gr01-1014_18]TSC99525.1 MAG: hypothetical protein Greene101420_192 [Parcubacteria group bacterium Greene1014_20]TSD07556.1 MAG: hypothetical protein Greene07142_13 [Parcubacteria group bacterium Greene0714_2]
MKVNQKGFTLVELLVVVSIIGLLSTLAIVALGSARVKARDAKRVSDIRQLQTAVELFYSDKNGYPLVAAGGLVLGAGAGSVLSEDGFVAAADPALKSVYMGKVPKNPLPGGKDYKYTGLKADRTECAVLGECVAYKLEFKLETNSTGLDAGDRVATPEGIN